MPRKVELKKYLSKMIAKHNWYTEYFYDLFPKMYSLFYL